MVQLIFIRPGSTDVACQPGIDVLFDTFSEGNFSDAIRCDERRCTTQSQQDARTQVKKYLKIKSNHEENEHESFMMKGGNIRIY